MTLIKVSVQQMIYFDAQASTSMPPPAAVTGSNIWPCCDLDFDSTLLITEPVHLTLVSNISMLLCQNPSSCSGDIWSRSFAHPTLSQRWHWSQTFKISSVYFRPQQRHQPKTWWNSIHWFHKHRANKPLGIRARTHKRRTRKRNSCADTYRRRRHKNGHCHYYTRQWNRQYYTDDLPSEIGAGLKWKANSSETCLWG